MGFAVITGNGKAIPIHVDSGVEQCIRQPNEAYQVYRSRLIQHWAAKTYGMIRIYDPDLIAYETLPVKGFRDMSQALLASAAITAVHAIGVTETIPVQTYAASSVKARIAGSNRATKVGVRKGVQYFLPELDTPGWPQYPDESDAVAIGLTALGYKI